MYVQKYSPETLEQYFRYFAKNDRELERVIHDWIAKGAKIPLLLYGAPGTGKTSLAYALAKTYNLNIVEVNAHNVLEFKLEEIGKNDLFGRKTLILIDDLESILDTARFDINSIIRSELPVIITANDIWDQRLRSIREMIKSGEIIGIEMKISKATYINILRSVIERENIELSDDDIQIIVEYNYPDIRAAMNDLEIKAAMNRAKYTNVFQILNYILSTKPRMIETRRYLEENLNIEEYRFLMYAIENNLLSRYNEYLKDAYQYLSIADFWYSRVTSSRRWNLFPYVARFLASISILKNSDSRARVTLPKFKGYTKQEEIPISGLHMSKKKLLKYHYLFKNVFS